MDTKTALKNRIKNLEVDIKRYEDHAANWRQSKAELERELADMENRTVVVPERLLLAMRIVINGLPTSLANDKLADQLQQAMVRLGIKEHDLLYDLYNQLNSALGELPMTCDIGN